jgi:hypothetical protein
MFCKRMKSLSISVLMLSAAFSLLIACSGSGSSDSSDANTVTEVLTAPVFSQEGGLCFGPQSIKLTCSTSGAVIHYEKGGAIATASSPVYAPASIISISTIGSQTISAVAVKNGEVSSVNTKTFTMHNLYIAGRAGTEPCVWKNNVCTNLTTAGGIVLNDRSGDAYALTLSAGSSQTNVSIVGYYNNTSASPEPCYWLNGSRSGLDTARNSLYPGETGDTGTTGIVVVGGSTYISGRYDTNAGGSYMPAPCYWKDGVRTNLPLASASWDKGYGLGIAVVGTDIYVSGYGNVNTLNVPYYWKNGVRYTLSTDTGVGVARGIVAVGSDIYIAGFGTLLYSQTQLACYWKNGTRKNMTVATTAKNSDAFVITVSGTNVYTAGYCNSSSNVSVPCFWKDGVKTDLSVPDSTKSSMAQGITVIDGFVLVSGFYTSTDKWGDSVRVPCYWVDGVRHELPIGSFEYGDAWGIQAE